MYFGHGLCAKAIIRIMRKEKKIALHLVRVTTFMLFRKVYLKDIKSHH